MLQELTRSLQQRPTKAHVLWELAGCICSAVGAERYRLYLADRGDPEMLSLYLGHDGRYVTALYVYGPRYTRCLSSQLRRSSRRSATLLQDLSDFIQFVHTNSGAVHQTMTQLLH